MDAERRILHEGVDSWDGEMTYQGITYMVEVDQEDSRTWRMEVLIERRGCSFLGRYYPTVEPLHSSVHPTLQAALDAAADYIKSLYTDIESTQKG